MTASRSTSRASPNIVVTGTPGTGKTSHSEALAESTGLRHLSVNDVVKERECHDGWSEEHHSWLVNEEKLLDALEDEVKDGGCIIDWHACDLFPERWVDLVVVLRASSETLYDRLAQRNYAEAKMQENMDAEIMQVVLDEARDAYAGEMVVELQSNTTEDMDANIGRMEEWVRRWKEDQKGA